ncbi:hypothetical protein [Haloferula sp. BvORR071]|uniref:L,D-transpeptidase family protein n=1 Tax=Haloferula sp. BvORR071 TaxID=1396141 RepID=UPI000696E721|nr:hypothetical protein [Haloferula sp. BvORR071]
MASTMMSRKRAWWMLGSLAVLLGARGIELSHGQDTAGLASVKMPQRLAHELPDSCRQVLLVLTAEEKAPAGKLWLMERKSGGEAAWQTVKGPIPVAVGRNGLAWGIGEHRGEPPAGFRIKKEGDGCAPAGVFRIPFAFGYAPAAGDLRLSYRPLTADCFGVDDGQSKFYNQVVDSTTVSRDWKSAETMVREEGLYRRGAFVAHNPNNMAGSGSCIFLHIWKGAGVPTSGCTAMAEDQLGEVLRWLDTKKEPRLVQGVEGW